MRESVSAFSTQRRAAARSAAPQRHGEDGCRHCRAGRPLIARAAASIRIWLGSAPVFAGRFIAEAEGVEVAIQTRSGGGAAMNALAAGQVDLVSASESMARMSRAESAPSPRSVAPGAA